MARAVIFTHVKEYNKLDTAMAVGKFKKHRQRFFESCLKCPNIAIVYVYSSFGVEKYVEALFEHGTQAAVPMHVLDGEERLHDALETTVDDAAEAIGGSDDIERVKERGPKFVFIGVREMACLVLRLQVQRPDLVLSLASKGEFTYDSPKFVEAILRLVRSHDRRLANDPVIRIDADVEVNADALKIIIDAAVSHSHGNAVAWFSGSYCGETKNDPVNAFAVRQHWLISPDTRSDSHNFTLMPGGEHFLSDLAEIGATQFAASTAPPLSKAGTVFIAKKRGGHSKARHSPQVISGAGLFASPAAIQILPPFMNAPGMVVWIDDHLKRLLHEALGHFEGQAPIECVAGATMHQNRFPTGISEADIANAPDYFERLLTGCVMEATIQDARGKAGPLTKAVGDVLKRWPSLLTPQKRKTLVRTVRAAAERRFDEAIWLWRNADYGNSDLKEWASSSADKREICDLVVDICVAYVELCILWPRHVATINNLKPHEAYWAFTQPRPVATPTARRGGRR